MGEHVANAFNTIPLSVQVESALKEEIISGRLLPGQRIDLARLAQSWNVSPTPLRDAVRSLDTQGLVEISPRKGVFVAATDRKALKEIFELRVALECAATELATPIVPREAAEDALGRYQRARDAASERERQKALSAIDNLIHDLIIRNCGNTRLKRIMDGLRDHVRWSQQTIIARVREPFNETLPEHIRICEAVVARDVAGAVAAMREHLQNTFRRIDTLLGEQEQEAAARQPRPRTSPMRHARSGSARR